MTEEIEKDIAEKLVKAAINRGYVVSVDDGEAFPIRKSSDAAAILDAMFSTDCDVLHIRKAGGEDKVGAIALIYGNGKEVISDYTDNAPICELVREAEGGQ